MHRTLSLGLVLALAACSNPRTSARSIRIEELPRRGADASSILRGRVLGFDPREHRVAGYVHVEGAGWWSKPVDGDPAAPIAPDGSFSMRVVDGGLDEYASIHAVAVVPIESTPPLARGTARIPAELASLAMDAKTSFRRTLRFSGRTWGVKEAPRPVGPGGNRFSSDERDVYVDERGRLHLSVRRRGDVWCASEVVLLERVGFGTYSIQTDSRLDVLDPRLTFGAFLWDSYGDDTSDNPHREIDFEDTRWGDATKTTSSQFVVQPFPAPEHLQRYGLPDLTSDARVTRVFEWSPDHVRFTAARGHHSVRSIPAALVFASYEYARAAERPVPTAGREQFRINLWMNSTELGGASPPAPPAAEVEVVVTAFEFVPAAR